jgi:acyl CoA:acetate/3-ketoacid CoA transferase alpha subunit
MIDKRVINHLQAVKDIPDGAHLAVGGLASVGFPNT